jgi:hypothetical protein
VGIRYRNEKCLKFFWAQDREPLIDELLMVIAIMEVKFKESRNKKEDQVRDNR